MAFAPDYPERPLLRQLHRPERRHPGRRLPASAPKIRPGRPGERAGSSWRRPALRQPQRRRARSSGRDGELWIGFGDGGSAGDPDADRPGPRPCWPRCSASTRRPERPAEIYASAFATRGASPSTGVPAAAIGDVGQDRFEEVDYVRRPALRTNSAGRHSRGSPLQSRRAGARSDPCRRSLGRAAGLLGDRRRRRPRPEAGGAAGASPRWRLWRRAPAEFLPPRRSGGRARADRSLGLEVPQLTSFGEDSRGRIYAASQAGPVYRIDPSG